MRAKHSSASSSGMEALGVVLRTQNRQARRPGPNPRRVGSWELGTDEAGNLVAKFLPTGDVKILAEVPAKEVGTDG